MVCLHDGALVAVIWRNMQTSNWQYRIFQRNERGVMIPVASDYGLPEFPQPCVRGKLQVLLFTDFAGETKPG